MGLIFVDSQGNPTGSTELGRSVLRAALNQNLEHLEKVNSLKNWREDYLHAFRAVAKAELQDSRSALNVATAGLQAFENSVLTENGKTLLSEISDAWRTEKSSVALVVISGTGSARKIDISAEALVANHLAEPGVIAGVSQYSRTDLDDYLLIGLAGGAEYSPARSWLDLGGTVAIAARPRQELWIELIARARDSAGTLYVPVLKSRVPNIDPQQLSDTELAKVAGLDLVVDYLAIAGWLSMLARTETRKLVLGSYAYAPGVKHIEVQAVQHCLARVMTESLPKSRVSLTWLATPTDSYLVPVELAEDIAKRYGSRNLSTKIRDFLFMMKPHVLEEFKTATGENLYVMDATSSLQGPSYALAKRLQRWLAYQQLFADRHVAYLVSPPATTESVLSKRILRATYAGAPRFGLKPFETQLAVDLSTILLISALSQPQKPSVMGSYLNLAVHGGLWRLIYSPKSVWRASTIRGLFALLRPYK